MQRPHRGPSGARGPAAGRSPGRVPLASLPAASPSATLSPQCLPERAKSGVEARVTHKRRGRQPAREALVARRGGRAALTPLLSSLPHRPSSMKPLWRLFCLLEVLWLGFAYGWRPPPSKSLSRGRIRLASAPPAGTYHPDRLLFPYAADKRPQDMVLSALWRGVEWLTTGSCPSAAEKAEARSAAANVESKEPDPESIVRRVWKLEKAGRISGMRLEVWSRDSVQS
jgi:hypothetical protein